MGQFEIVMYKDNKGDCPFLDFYRDLKKEKMKGIKESRVLFDNIALRFTHLRKIGTRKGMPDFRSIKGSRYSLWEIRIRHSRGYFRLFICPWGSDKYVVLNHFWKKDAKTPKGEIRKAERMMDEFINKYGSGK